MPVTGEMILQPYANHRRGEITTIASRPDNSEWCRKRINVRNGLGDQAAIGAIKQDAKNNDKIPRGNEHKGKGDITVKRSPAMSLNQRMS
jgi:hypothetical protein